MTKTAILTAAGSGMGAAIARKLAADGYSVAIVSSSGKGEALAKELGGIGVTGSNLEPGDLKRLVNPVIDELDHRCLNEIAGLENPTSELVAAWIWRRLHGVVPDLAEIVVHETCTARCEYRGG